MVKWSARVFFGVLVFAFFFAPLLYLIALAVRFNGLALGGTVLGLLVAGYLVIYLGVRVSRAARRRREEREIRHAARADAAAKTLDDLRIEALHPVKEEIWLHDLVSPAAQAAPESQTSDKEDPD